MDNSDGFQGDKFRRTDAEAPGVWPSPIQENRLEPPEAGGIPEPATPIIPLRCRSSSK